MNGDATNQPTNCQNNILQKIIQLLKYLSETFAKPPMKAVDTVCTGHSYFYVPHEVWQVKFHWKLVLWPPISRHPLSMESGARLICSHPISEMVLPDFQ
jgi:hypothetical protein